MEETRLVVQSTPNPNALKFVLNIAVKTEGNCTYKRDDDFSQNVLAEKIFHQSKSVLEVYFFDNYITITQDGNADWDELEEQIKETILVNIQQHNPNFEFNEKELMNQNIEPEGNSEDIKGIEEILNETVRPALQMDGGDIQIVSYGENKILKVFYQGACGSCPSASMGTMMAIQNILRERFDSEITVEIADML